MVESAWESSVVRLCKGYREVKGKEKVPAVISFLSYNGTSQNRRVWRITILKVENRLIGLLVDVLIKLS